MTYQKVCKVGILSMRYAKNYGGILQCIALYNVLRNMGFDVKVIDFAPSTKNGLIRKLKISLTSFASIKNFFQKILNNFLSKKKNTKNLSQSYLDNFKKFKNENLSFTQSVNEYTIGIVAQQFDAIIVGSDQIWNGFDREQLIYLFDWIPEFTGLRLSYAPCSIYSTSPDINKLKIKDLLLKFHGISVRDITTQKLVETSCGIMPEIVADPTILYDFKNLITKPDINEPYIFAYILGNEIVGRHDNVLNDIREKYGNIKVYAIVIPSISLEAEKFADVVYYDASPQLWLTLIAHANFVYTDSFHGCMFAMKYKRPFLAYYRESSRASRLLDLQKRFGVTDVIVSSVKEMREKKSIKVGVDYKIVDELAGKIINDSLDYLKKYLKY